MTSEEELRLKLRKIEALFEGAGTAGERDAAGAARERIKERLAQAIKDEPPLEYTFTFGDQWSKQLFTALCPPLLFGALSVCTAKIYDSDGTCTKSVC
jgi:hypothetical protein